MSAKIRLNFFLVFTVLSAVRIVKVAALEDTRSFGLASWAASHLGRVFPLSDNSALSQVPLHPQNLAKIPVTKFRPLGRSQTQATYFFFLHFSKNF